MASSQLLHASLHASSLLTIANLTHPHDPDIIDKIDAEIARSEDPVQIRLLRQLRNTVVPIARFPPEILSKVFIHSHELDLGGNYYTRLVISWISRQWREIAIGDPVLWSFIRIVCLHESTEPGRKEYALECLTRSKSIPLKLEYYGPRSELLTMCSSQIHRIRKLCIGHRFTKNELQPLTDDWKHPAPMLVRLDLIGVDLREGGFGGAHPALRTLALDSCDFVWESPISKLRTLTKLDINRPNDRTTPEEIVITLQALPALRSCSFNHCFSWRVRPVVTISEPYVHLQHLESITITHHIQEPIVDLLQRLDIPNASVEVTTELELDFNSIESDDFDEGGAVSRAFQWFGEYQRRNFKNIQSLSTTRAIQVRTGILGSFSATVSSLAPNRQFTFTLECETSTFEVDPIVNAYPHLPLGDTPDLSLNMVSVQGLAIITPLPLVDTLTVEGVREDFVGWARKSAGEIFPSVSDLVVNGVWYPDFESFINESDEGRFPEVWEDSDDDDSEYHSDPFLKMIHVHSGNV